VLTLSVLQCCWFTHKRQLQQFLQVLYVGLDFPTVFGRGLAENFYDSWWIVVYRALKPFIRRDYESRPLRLRLLQEIVAHSHRLIVCIFLASHWRWSGSQTVCLILI